MCGIASALPVPQHRRALPSDFAFRMRIVCPSCSAAYDVPDSLVTAGRIVRCARCGGEWTPVDAAVAPPPEPLPVEEPVVPPPPPAAEQPATWSVARQSAMDRLAAHPAQPPSRLPLHLAWVASLLVLVLAVLSAYAWRTQIVSAWPPSERAYAVFGMHPDTQ